MSPTSYQTAPPRSLIIVNAPTAVNYAKPLKVRSASIIWVRADKEFLILALACDKIHSAQQECERPLIFWDRDAMLLLKPDNLNLVRGV